MRRLLVPLLAFLVSLPLFAAFSGTDVFVGAVGRGPGAAGSDWYTSVWIHNPGASPATVTAYLLQRNQTNPSPATQTIVVQPGETRRIDNIVESLFGVTAFGAMRFTSASRIVVNARIYSKALGAADSDSSGQSFDGVPSSFAIGAGQSTVVVGAHQTAPLETSLFRYNFGYVETTGGSGVLHASAADALGVELGAKDYPFGPYEARQFGVADVVPGVNTTNLRLTLSVTSGSGKILAFGSGIANHSNDPTTFDMSYRNELLAGPATPSSITHDATLTGDGSAATPLGVATLGISAANINSNGGTAGYVLMAGTGSATSWVPASAVFDGALPYRTSFAPSTPRAIIDVANFGTADGNFGLAGTGGIVGVGGFATSGTGVLGSATTSGSGVVGKSISGPGLTGTSNSSMGVLAQTSTGIAVYAQAVNGVGLRAESQSTGGGAGIEATSLVKEGVKATSEQFHGVWGESHANSGYGVVGFNSPGNHAGLIGTLGFAGDFVGDVRVKGNLTKFSGAFTIDHPLDPEHKTLSHSFVESPDMKNVYDGIVVTDADGFAAVELPDWFEALNGDFRYQLTVIGRFAQAIVDTEIANNRFTIRTDRPNVKVSWQVTGIRHDAWANAHRIVVEEEKPPEEQGYYLAPEVYGKSRDRDVFWAKHPEIRK
jgi:hypothetical protein